MTPNAPRSAAEIAREWVDDLLPPGNLRGPNVRALMRGLAGPREVLEGDVASVCREICPGVASALLADYRALLGDDPFGRDIGNLTDDQWRLLLQQRWTGRGDQRPEYYRNLARQIGVDVTIWEPDAPVVGPTICGTQQLADSPVLFAWIVRLPDSVTEAQLAQLRSVFTLLKPADTDVYFLKKGAWV